MNPTSLVVRYFNAFQLHFTFLFLKPTSKSFYVVKIIKLFSKDGKGRDAKIREHDAGAHGRVSQTRVLCTDTDGRYRYPISALEQSIYSIRAKHLFRPAPIAVDNRDAFCIRHPDVGNLVYASGVQVNRGEVLVMGQSSLLKFFSKAAGHQRLLVNLLTNPPTP